MTKIFDCIIVGAGPAGGTAAYHLSKKGHSVLVLEKASLPRSKPCGGGVSSVIQEWFDFDFSPAISLKTNAVYLTYNKKNAIQVDIKNYPIWMVKRDIFDHFLVQQAQQNGAKVQDNTEVTGIEFKSERWLINTNQESFTGHYLIAADGSKGKMSKWLGFQQQKKIVAGALEFEIPIENQTDINIYFELGLAHSGYVWNFPKADGFSLGAGAFGEKRKAQNFKNIIRDYGTMFKLDLATATESGHPIFLWNGDQKLHTQNAVLAGEAACVVDPFTAEGIRPSIFSGMKAAEAIDKALANQMDALEQYSETITQEWGKEMSSAKRLAQVFWRFQKLGYQVVLQRPSAIATMTRIFSGELQYSNLVNRAISLLESSLTF
ncbi:geranylgeranyl reductase family protein [Moorena sp. SIO3B2]|uniref:geranylgeranyl reductase family protein n=1 Tax=Moorena sp. SIO3B2 TaxID=2607827 RepID=UPI0013CD7C50|nr:geranylgeranyl reductase family protein [Moorena sp. SIO3B2]NEP35948.1 geranylgeranyl reductase family protein [Moorena sp. SIO3B2]